MSSKRGSSFVATNGFTSDGQILSKSSSRSSTSEDVSCTTHRLFTPHTSGVARTLRMIGHSMGTLRLYKLLQACSPEKFLEFHSVPGRF